MAETIENETKFELDAVAFHHLLDVANVLKCIEQTNVYYDRSLKLARLKGTCRVRFADSEEPVLTLKLPESQVGAMRRMKEFEYTLHTGFDERAIGGQQEIDVDRELPPDVAEALLRLGVNRLQRLGTVRNCRYVVRVAELGEVELDELHLPDGTIVYEAEIESDDTSTHERLTEWLLSIAPSARPSLISKFQRFWTALRDCELAQDARFTYLATPFTKAG